MCGCRNYDESTIKKMGNVRRQRKRLRFNIVKLANATMRMILVNVQVI